MSKSQLVFVIQKHDATSLHYDFRLQIGKGMASWAIPKGPTLNPSEKRLAMETPLHPMEYNKFEGIIEEGHYGAGPVIIWDEGTYIPEIEISKGVREEIKDFKKGEEIMEEGLKKGEIKFFLNGKRLQGSFALVKTKGFPPGVKNAWLLIKHKDEYVNDKFDIKEYSKSVQTGKTIEEIK